MSETVLENRNENTENIDQKALELAQDFSYDGFQVVRRELFAHLRYGRIFQISSASPPAK